MLHFHVHIHTKQKKLYSIQIIFNIKAIHKFFFILVLKRFISDQSAKFKSLENYNLKYLKYLI